MKMHRFYIKRMRKKRKKSKAELHRRSLLKKQLQERRVAYRRNDQLLTTEFRQKLRIQKLEETRHHIAYALKSALLITTLKQKVNKATQEVINIEVQNTIHFINTVRSIMQKMFVRQSIIADEDVNRIDTDTEYSKRRLAQVYLLFKSFDFDQTVDIEKYASAIRAPEIPREDAKLAEIKAEEQRCLNQLKSLKMEIEDNEIRIVAKEQILRENLEEQEQQIIKLEKQIMGLKRKMGVWPAMSSIARFMDI